MHRGEMLRAVQRLGAIGRAGWLTVQEKVDVDPLGRMVHTIHAENRSGESQARARASQVAREEALAAPLPGLLAPL